MDGPVKSALIVGAAIVFAVLLYIYFSPYQSCMRNVQNSSDPAVTCAALLGGYKR